MNGLYIIDTNAIISYFDHVFEAPSTLSPQARSLMDAALSASAGEVKISIPSIVFVEIFEKWLDSEEMSAKFYYEAFALFELSPNIEIKPVEREVLENILQIRGSLANHEMHDKIIVACAMMLNCAIITTDTKIREYVEVSRLIPSVVS
jgi:predicted nucleic acid-binding protein